MMMTTSSMGAMDASILNDIIKRLLVGGKGGRFRQVQLSELEIRQLCVEAKQVFLSQPNLLEIQAPIKICVVDPRHGTKRRENPFWGGKTTARQCLAMRKFCFHQWESPSHVLALQQHLETGFLGEAMPNGT